MPATMPTTSAPTAMECGRPPVAVDSRAASTGWDVGHTAIGAARAKMVTGAARCFMVPLVLERRYSGVQWACGRGEADCALANMSTAIRYWLSVARVTR